MIVVSDTSPLSSLLQINSIYLLKSIYGKIILPNAVMDELNRLESKGIDLSAIKNADWIEVKSVHDFNAVENLMLELDRGESEAIVLAKEIHSDLLLMDEAKGRHIADLEGLKTIGVLGILVIAKNKKLINSVKEKIDEMKLKANFWIKEDLYKRVLESVNEI